MSRRKAALMRVIGKALRAHYDDIERQPLSPRWLDLIRRMEDRVRQLPGPIVPGTVSIPRK